MLIPIFQRHNRNYFCGSVTLFFNISNTGSTELIEILKLISKNSLSLCTTDFCIYSKISKYIQRIQTNEWHDLSHIRLTNDRKARLLSIDGCDKSIVLQYSFNFESFNDQVHTMKLMISFGEKSRTSVVGRW